MRQIGRNFFITERHITIIITKVAHGASVLDSAGKYTTTTTNDTKLIRSTTKPKRHARNVRRGYAHIHIKEANFRLSLIDTSPYLDASSHGRLRVFLCSASSAQSDEHRRTYSVPVERCHGMRCVCTGKGLANNDVVLGTT